MPTVNDYVCIWFTRQTVGDFRVSLRSLESGMYRVRVMEDDKRDPYSSSFLFGSYQTACEYIDILVKQILADEDHEHPFLQFQYSVPFFPTVMMPVHHINFEDNYKTFTDAVDFYFS
jgi:hypothetical protein